MKKIISKLKEFDLEEFLINTPELEFFEKCISFFTSKYLPAFHKWGSNILNSLCECKDGEMFNFFTGILLAVYMAYWSARLMTIIFIPTLILILLTI